MKRRQKNIRPKSRYMMNFMDELNQTLSSLLPHLKQNDWVCIKSMAKCKAQAAHIDYPPPFNENCEISQIPINVLVALQDETYLYVWPKSHKVVAMESTRSKNQEDPEKEDQDQEDEIIHMKILEMKQGDIVLFRGDLVHAGAKYDKENYRLHCFMDYEYRIPNRTWLVHGDGSEYLKKVIAIS